MVRGGDTRGAMFLKFIHAACRRCRKQFVLNTHVKKGAQQKWGKSLFSLEMSRKSLRRQTVLRAFLCQFQRAPACQKWHFFQYYWRGNCLPCCPPPHPPPVGMDPGLGGLGLTSGAENKQVPRNPGISI